MTSITIDQAPSEPEHMSTDESREYLVKFMEQHFTDKTFHRYIRGERGSVNLAGDFAWQMARALRKIDAAPTAVAATTSEDARDAERLRWLAANPTWGTRWRIKNNKGVEQWQMMHDGESWGQWGDYRKVIDAAMRATQQEGE